MAELTSERIEELRRVAEAATPIGWVVGNLFADERQVMTADGYLVVATIGEAKNAWHIAAFDPPTVLALLDELDRLRELIVRADSQLSYLRQRADIDWPVGTLTLRECDELIGRLRGASL